MSNIKYGRAKPRSRNSIWIEREDKPDIFGALKNARASTKNSTGFTLQKGDLVSFLEGVDATRNNEPTALEITLVQGVRDMNKGNQQGNNQQQKQNQPQSRLFVDLPDSGEILRETKKGFYKITVRVGQIPDSTERVRARIYLVAADNRQMIKSKEISLAEDLDLGEHKLDLSQSNAVEIEKVGFANSKDSKDFIPLPKSGKKAAAAKETRKRFYTEFVEFATGNAPNLIRAYLKDSSFEATGGKVQIFLGQSGKVDGNTPVDGVAEVDIPDSGSKVLRVQLDDRDAVVLLMDVASGQSSEEFLRKSKTDSP